MTASLILILVAAGFVSWMIGANSVSTTFGPVAGTHVGGVLRSALLAGFFGLIGAVVQGGRVAGTVGSGLLPGIEISALMGSIILLSASFLVIIGVFFHIPTPVAFTVVGGVLGAGIGFDAAWDMGQVKLIVSTWVLLPFIAVALGYFFARILRFYLSRGDSKKSLGFILFLIGAFCAYTAGANLGGVAIGPLIKSVGLSLRLLLLMGGIIIMIGSWIGGPRIVSAVSKDYSEMGIRRSICALATATMIAQSATIFGIPVSFNEAIIFSMIGSGLVAGVESIQVEKIVKTTMSWVLSFFAALGLSWGAVMVFLV